MLRAVSLGPPSARSPGHTPTIGGELPSTLKKLNGAALTTPSGPRVVTQAMGRGVTRETRRAYARLWCAPSRSSSILARVIAQTRAAVRAGRINPEQALRAGRGAPYRPVSTPRADGPPA